jgi:hypothetical protein
MYEPNLKPKFWKEVASDLKIDTRKPRPMKSGAFVPLALVSRNLFPELDALRFPIKARRLFASEVLSHQHELSGVPFGTLNNLFELADGKR